MRMRPFFSFYGSKWRTIPLYPAPTEPRIIEPFAGSATYALHYADRQVHLNDADPIIYGVWHYLINTRASEIRSLPTRFESTESLNIPQEAKWLIGFWLAKAATRPFTRRIGWANDPVYARNYWCEERRERVASQVDSIRHWTVSNKSYDTIRYDRATWFIDPPYVGKAGRAYNHNILNYNDLGKWCRSRNGQTIVCENLGADWLPFTLLGNFKTARDGKSAEAMWTSKSAVNRVALFPPATLRPTPS